MSSRGSNNICASSKDSSARPTVLIADDHPRILDSVTLLLAEEFTVVGAVADGAALIAAARELQPDLIITDLVMEPTTGLEAAAVLLGNGQPRPLMILLTGISDPELVTAAFEAGIRGYVSKLRLSEDLIPAIQTVLSGSRFVSNGFDRS